MIRHMTLLCLALALYASPALAQSESEPLVTRQHIHLTLPGAKAILEGAEAKAKSMNLKVNIAIVDDGGNLLAFVRMDGARPASANTSLTKAVAAATFRQATGPLPNPNGGDPDPILNLSVPLAAGASGGKLTVLYGGVPIEVEGQIIGGVGVGGATGQQDAEIARAGIARLVEQLKPAQP